VPSGQAAETAVARPVVSRSQQAGLFPPDDHAERQQDHGRGAAVHGPAERDLDVVPGRQVADHEQPELLAARQVELGRAGQAPVDVLEFVGGQAQAAVFDLRG